uniref:Uncharacterized protein n=1 Tax=Sphaerodactylus townsendi TaxID=933632 RepID=A0ACB8F3N7_9SAUR
MIFPKRGEKECELARWEGGRQSMSLWHSSTFSSHSFGVLAALHLNQARVSFERDFFWPLSETKQIPEAFQIKFFFSSWFFSAASISFEKDNINTEARAY